MAALTCAVTTNNSSAVADRVAAKTTMRGLIHGDAPITLGKGLKAAFVVVTFDGGDYAAAGVLASMLTALPGWTAILGATTGVFTDTVVKLADYNTVSDKVIVHVSSTGAEHAAAALSGAVKLLIFGY